MKKLALAFGLLLALLAPAVSAQTACSQMTQNALLAQFPDNAPAASIIPRYLRNFICSTTTTLPNIAQLRTGTAVASSLNILAYSQAGDGGGGPFNFNPLDTSSSDNGVTIIKDALNRRWYRQFTGPVNVAWAGAKCDGSTDDTAAFQAAANAATGTAVIISPGKAVTCVLKNLALPSNVALLMNGSSVKLPSSGVGGSDIIITATGSNNLIDCGGGSVSNTSPAQTSSLIFLNGAVNPTVQNCTFPTGVYYLAVSGNQSVNALVQRNYFTATTAEYPALWFANLTGFGQSHPKNCQARSNVFQGTGVQMSCDGGVVDSNQFYSSNLGGAILGFDDRGTADSYISNNISITNNVIDTVPLNATNDGTGMELDGANYTVLGNRIRNTAKTCMVFHSITGLVITGNICQNFGTASLDETDSSAIVLSADTLELSSAVITANEFLDTQPTHTGTHGVVMTNGGFPYVVSNVVISNNSAIGLLDPLVAVLTLNANPVLGSNITVFQNTSDNANNYLFANQVACSAATVGSQAFITNSSVNSWGSIIAAGAPMNNVMGFCNGSNYTVMGK